MKYLLLVLLLVFSGCEPPEAEEDKKKLLENEDKKTKNISYGGDGSFSSPYKSGNGSYGANHTFDTFYSITLTGSCNILLYEVNYNSDFSLLDTSANSFDVNSSNIDGDLISFNLYKSIDSGTYHIKNNVSSVENSRFGIYGLCVNDVYSYTLKTPIIGDNTFSTGSKIYTFTLDATSTVEITRKSNLNNFYIFDSNLNLLHSKNENTFSVSLGADTYYLLLGSTIKGESSTFYFNK